MTDSDGQRRALASLQAQVEKLPPAEQLTPAELSEHLAARESLLAAAKGLDLRALPVEVQAEVRQQLQTLLQHTQQLVDELQRRLEQLRTSSSKLVKARSALRGYRPNMARTSRGCNRTV